MDELESKIPKYWALAEEIRQRIERGELQPGDRLPSRAEVQAERGVSAGTAEKAFSELERLGLIVREQGRGTFVASMQRKKTGLIGFVGTTFAVRKKAFPEAYMSEAIENAVAAAGKRLVLLDASSVGWDQIEGVIVVSLGLDVNDPLHNLLPYLPAVALLQSLPGMASVTADEAAGARAATEHLLMLGHKRIGCLFNELHAATEGQTLFRYEGYHAALRAAGIEPAPDWEADTKIIMTAELGYRRWGYVNMQQWLQTGWYQTECTALLAQNDLAAVGAIEALQEAGLRVPQDVSVIGFDSTEICECVSPTVSAVKVPLREISVRGVELLLKLIEQGAAPEQILLPASLDIRESTAPPSFRTVSAPAATDKPRRRNTESSRLLNLVEGVLP